MGRKSSKRALALQPPTGFRISRPDGVMTLSDSSSVSPDSEGLYHLKLYALPPAGWFRSSRLARASPGARNG
jgi:hypothetical protein